MGPRGEWINSSLSGICASIIHNWSSKMVIAVHWIENAYWSEPISLSSYSLHRKAPLYYNKQVIVWHIACWQVYRVYYDRLVDETDRLWLFDLLQNMVKKHFKEDFQSLFKHLATSGAKVVDDNMRSLLFGDYTKPDAVRDLLHRCVVGFSSRSFLDHMGGAIY